jgi:UDP-N-acetyl-2-amino-2-deoxyglucuronate dehydrogenase
MPKTYTAAIVGLGGFSRTHALAHALVPRVRLVAACDVNPARHAAWADRLRDKPPVDEIRFYTDAAALLAAEQPDLVTITTKHDQHAPLTILCAEAGVKGIVCEKPIAMDLGEADAMLAACRRARTKLAIGHQRRFDREWQAGLRLVRQGKIGKVLLAISRWPDDRAAKYRYDLFGGGPLMWLSIHSIDLLRYFLGEVAWVTAQVDMGEPALDTESRACALLAFRGGSRAIVECGTGIGPEASLGHSIVFFGEKGTVHVCDGYGVRYKTTARPRWRQVKVDLEVAAWSVNARRSLADQLRDLIRAIERGREPRCSGKQGRADLEAVMAIYRSEQTGGPVRLPLKRKTSPLAEMNRAGGFGQVTWKPAG